MLKVFIFNIVKKSEIDSTNKELTKLKDSSTKNDSVHDIVTGTFFSQQFRNIWVSRSCQGQMTKNTYL